jgi:hypothetical protein
LFCFPLMSRSRRSNKTKQVLEQPLVEDPKHETSGASARGHGPRESRARRGAPSRSRSKVSSELLINIETSKAI